MQGRHTGFAGLLRQTGVNCPVLHCIKHQALCGKHLNFGHVMDVVGKVSDLIRGGKWSQNHWKCVAFLEAVDAAYGDLQWHTDIRWMEMPGEVLATAPRDSRVFGEQHYKCVLRTK
ncbi:hypothetical protein DPEC_G00258890 [Dallia pectoralis]|uniref:Uncharacterized protein n=1 Tax=Dallia pectoralis TaxID=75939 RepID=A0ACC2FR81_DALPE|nr:hypothetical protein DPEC_G00258890 [Dallia pectoralis]